MSGFNTNDPRSLENALSSLSLTKTKPPITLEGALSSITLTNTKNQQMEEYLAEIQTLFHRAQSTHTTVFARYSALPTNHQDGEGLAQWHGCVTLGDTMYCGVLETMGEELVHAEEALACGKVDCFWSCLRVVEEFVGPILKEVLVMEQTVEALEKGLGTGAV